ncbi:hypothetical protein LEMLEM_LOCUS1317, partial [Lemmus lemmus]
MTDLTSVMESAALERQSRERSTDPITNHPAGRSPGRTW